MQLFRSLYKPLLAIAGISLLIFGCTGKKKENVLITGTISDAGQNAKIYIDRIDISAVLPLDSSGIDENGNFRLTPKIRDFGFYRLRLSPANFLTLIVDTVDSIRVTASAFSIGTTYSVSGSVPSDRLRQVHQYIIRSNSQLDSLRRIFSAFQGTPSQDSAFRALENHFRMIQGAQMTFIRNFISSYPDDFSLLSAVQYLNPETDATYYIRAAEALTAKYPNSPLVKNLADRAKQLSRLATGTMAPEIVLNDPDGKPVALSALRGKIVLIDFWASWCRPCRMENPNVVRVYHKFRSKGFEIYGVSLDKNRDAWLNAIKTDGLAWVHVSDLAYWNSVVVKMYDISGIPMTVLIDREGKIIAKNLRGGALEQKLEEILGGG
ncbi:MAG: AhpC/TSA family protein [Bacteroidetes bacterium]|nr:AhpC/TSA family protein [Bacteroidota bacterium]